MHFSYRGVTLMNDLILKQIDSAGLRGSRAAGRIYTVIYFKLGHGRVETEEHGTERVKKT